jgi:hypothetical protein
MFSENLKNLLETFLLKRQVDGPLWALSNVLNYPFPTSIAEFHKEKELNIFV